MGCNICNIHCQRIVRQSFVTDVLQLIYEHLIDLQMLNKYFNRMVLNLIPQKYFLKTHIIYEP